ncbi:hypothetical protein GLOTRDRAFT_68181 [Gloeophyllum trabeum ATCC 11539]|uniref:Uncharacterized protein n=1 Tax=Gloeophyllum trabeum (strain ATCC 11539 / FP-39264 / Madison 617) TaxID=670483 RepID=S7QM34_GLOTA|nr:uncharacterized protein GLOTRDRAFT_68181 [Gloeophyllum trabeum ATCC 11539]EPQ60503.1 hypothetical protein GLOTRDRAFT_68181 [Gloeophyllum trabeum ATCC 11539]
MLPPLSEKKKAYKHFDDWDFDVSEEGPAGEPEEVIGDYEQYGQSYFFARLENGTIRRYSAARFWHDYEHLIQDYDRRKAEGNLAPFDPSSALIHPKSRVLLTISINRQMEKRRKGTQRNRIYVPDSDKDAVPDAVDESEGISDNEFALSEADVSGRRTTNVVAGGRKKTIRVLPFSPKKTRSGKAFIASDGSDAEEDGSDAGEVAPARRSTRARKSARGNLADEAYLDDELDLLADSDDESTRQRPAKKKAKQRRRKATRPAYGHLRSVDELEYDPYSDDETAPLRQHRNICEKCHRKPTHILLIEAKKGKRGRLRKNKNSDEEEDDDDIARVTALGGWVRCLKCPVAAHWGCLARTQQDEILKAMREKDRAQPSEDGRQEAGDGPVSQSATAAKPKKHAGLDVLETTEFLCGSCTKGGVCMGCMEDILDGSSDSVRAYPGRSPTTPLLNTGESADVEMKDLISDSAEEGAKASPRELLFRCFTCKRVAHYAHLRTPSGFDDTEGHPTAVELAEYYQAGTKWLCADCVSYTFSLDKILAWRPYPPTAAIPSGPTRDVPNYRSNLPREYLVKWADRSYRRLTWVPHMWLATMHGQKLKNFIETGPKVPLLSEPLPEANGPTTKTAQNSEEEVENNALESSPPTAVTNDEVPSNRITFIPGLPPPPLSDAERRIPSSWKTVDRVLDALFWCPSKRDGTKKQGGRKKQSTRRKARKRTSEDTDDELLDEEYDEARYTDERDAAFDQGEQPSADLTETLDEWEERTGHTLTVEDVDKLIDRVVWAFIKWDDMGYEEATWDSPPRRGESGWEAFRKAFERLIASRDVVVHMTTKAAAPRAKDQFRRQFAFKDGAQPSLGQSSDLKLMPFQVDGVNWLCNNWWNLQHCILADEMGLGKTVQIAAFIGTVAERWEAFPALIVVPNSTITNWVREFERWAPRLRVVPFYGEAKAREVIKHYELTHSLKSAKTTGAKYHVLITTYDTVTNPKDFASVFKSTPRWEVLVVDEGQRLKGDGSLLFKKLKQLNTVHRVLMTGTPLNNNMRELFNLMNFLDPVEWQDLEKLEKEHEVLTEELVRELHQRLRPYFLRRTKSEVLPLPPKNEVIVPVSMTPLQKEIYRSILSQNFKVLQSLTQASKSDGTATKSNMNNMLMQLRKCLQHPYLVSDNIEPRGLPPAEMHEKLVGASAKLRLLKNMLPKLKARGHRVLLFSQFTIALDVIEDFLAGEGYKYLRLDGNTKQADRQKGMDEFNRPGSDVFIYILSTRAGGVGINLWSADTVIIFDPDFNPHQDLQAIARSHRYGQTKPCLVFKLLVKDSAEERIMQTGKKKLVLDHLIVQKMDDDETGKEDVQSILLFGAKALFEEGTDDSSRDINYTDQDLEKLIEKTETEGEHVDQEKQKDAGLFAFAKVWSADKDSFEEMPDAGAAEEGDSWAQTLQRIVQEREREQAHEVTGRGARRRTALIPQLKDLDLDDSPVKDEKDKNRRRKSKSKASDDESDAYTGSVGRSESEAEVPDDEIDGRALSPLEEPKKAKHVSSLDLPVPLSPIQNQRRHKKEDFERCGLCGTVHGPGVCYMTESSENLAEYRRMLLIHADDEPIEDRKAAIQVIDETLHKRGKIGLIHGQPLLLVDPPARSENIHREKPRTDKPSAVSAELSATAGPSSVKAAGVVAGPSKRPSSPLQGSNLKKAKHTPGDTPCVICGRLPHHLVKDCPVVAEGPKSVSREIQRLDNDPSQSQTVSILRKILSKQKKRELANAVSLGTVEPMLVD